MQTKPYMPPTPLPAATVIILREQERGFELYLLRRHAGSGFMAGTYVFPGGMVDTGDRRVDFWQDHVDLEKTEITTRLGGAIDTQGVLAYGIAAVRETFEEAGVLLADRKALATEAFIRIQTLRVSGRLPEDWLFNEVTGGGWTISLSALRRWAHWITPERMKRRFDTRFFASLMPDDQQCRPDHLETTHGLWSTPEKALAGNLAGKIPLSPPTLMTLHEMLQYRSIEGIWTESCNRSWGSALMPRLVKTESATLILRPDDPDYGQPIDQIRIRQPGRKPLGVGEPFTRLQHMEGIWRPVRH